MCTVELAQLKQMLVANRLLCMLKSTPVMQVLHVEKYVAFSPYHQCFDCALFDKRSSSRDFRDVYHSAHDPIGTCLLDET